MQLKISTKKLIIILSLLAALIAIVYLVYIFFFRPASPSEPNSQEVTASEKKQVIFPLSQEPVLSPTINSSGNKVRYYSKNNGNIYEVNFDGTGLSRISASNLAGLLNIIWSPDKEKVIGLFQKGDQIQKYLHNYQVGQSILMNSNINQIAWSPDGKKIALQTFNSETQTNTISISNADGSDLKDVFSTRLKDFILEWPTIDKISLRTKTSGLSDGLVLMVNPDNGSFSKVLGNIFGLNIMWSPLGNSLLYSSTTTDGKNPSLFLADQTGQTKKSIGFATLIEKCVFSQDNRTLFCAIPQTLSENAVWPDDYYKGMTTTADNFLKIDLEASQSSSIFSPNANDKTYDATGLFLSPKEDYLFFTNKKDGLVYSIKLE